MGYGLFMYIYYILLYNTCKLFLFFIDIEGVNRVAARSTRRQAGHPGL